VSIGTWNKCGKFCTNIIAVVLYRKKVANDYLTETRQFLFIKKCVYCSIIYLMM